MSFEKDQLNAELQHLDIDGFFNPPLFMVGTYKFKCAVDQQKQIWTTEHCADGDLLGWNDLLCDGEAFAVKQVKEAFGLDILQVIKWL